jgi:lipoprotein-anchoring transpeptidase ErfK/SrfK
VIVHFSSPAKSLPMLSDLPSTLWMRTLCGAIEVASNRKTPYFDGLRGHWVGGLMIDRLLAVCLVLLGSAWVGPAAARPLVMADVNAAEFPPPAKNNKRALLIKAQVLLDRAGFSPGVINGRTSGNLANAVRAFQQQNALDGSGELDAATWAKLTESSAEPALIAYVIGKEDVRGPFEQIPDSFAKKATLKWLAYTGPAELLAEKFHMDEELLEDLNPGNTLDQAGTPIVVANVRQALPKVEATRIVVEKSQRSVRALDRDGKLVGFYPASVGNDDKPAPAGILRITRIVQHPVYFYDPKFRFPGVEAQQRLRIAGGPNNPVGAVWMNLNTQTYGIHGTAEPAKIGKAYSHGCVRLTNWDARALAAMAKKGTTVEFVE